MTKQLLVSALAAMAVAGCATTGDQSNYAKADCKIQPITTASATGVRPGRAPSADQKEAEMNVATSQYRRSEYARMGMVNNNVEDAMRDCY
jgi:outer membrane lipoprotein SlyB